MTDKNRPYPDGIAWDEAYRQRKRADAAEETRDKLAEIVRRLAEAATKEVNPAESYKRIGYEAAKLWIEIQKGAGDE